MATIIANLNGGDETTPNNELIFKIYGDADNYTTAIATSGNAINDANVSVTGGVVTIANVDVTGQSNIKLTSIDAEGNQSDKSVAFVISNLQDAERVFSVYDLGLPFSNGNIVAIKETGGGTIQEFTVSELNDGTSLNTFCGANQGLLEYMISHIDGNTKTIIENDDTTKPIVYENNEYLGFAKCTAPQNIRAIFNEEFDTSNLTSLIVASNFDHSPNENFKSITEGNNDFTFLFMPSYGSDNQLNIAHNNTNSNFIFNTGLINLNKVGLNIVSYGFRNNELFGKLNSKDTASTPATGGGLDFVDLDMNGRNSGGNSLNIYAFAFWDSGLSDNDIEVKHASLKNILDVPDVELAPTFPLTVVPDGDGANTGLSYDPVLDEIIVSNWNGTSQNSLKIYRRSDMVLQTTINVNENNIQNNLVYNGFYYVGDNLIAYERNGTRRTDQDLTMPVAPDGQNMITLYDNHFWTISSGILQKIDPITMTVVDTFEGFTSSEGLAINEKYIATHILNNLICKDWSGKLIINIGSPEPEGICFDAQGNIYNNRDQFFHGGTVDGNRLWKYLIN